MAPNDPSVLIFITFVVRFYGVWESVCETSCVRQKWWHSTSKRFRPSLLLPSLGSLSLGEVSSCAVPTWWGTETFSQQPCEWIWKWVLQSRSNLMTATPADILIAASWAMLNQNQLVKLLPDFWPQKLWVSVCCFRPLSFGVICYTGIKNEYKLVDKQTKKKKPTDYKY